MTIEATESRPIAVLQSSLALVIGIALIAAAIGIVFAGAGPLAFAATGITGALGIALAGQRISGRAPTALAILVDVVALALIAAAIDPAAQVWQAPTTLLDFFRLSTVGAAFALALQAAASLYVAATARRPLQPLERVAVLILPFLINPLLALSQPAVVQTLGLRGFIGLDLGDTAHGVIGRTALLFLFNEAVFLIIGWLTLHRLPRDWRAHALLLGAAALAATTPVFADAAASAAVAELDALLRPFAVAVLAALSQAGLWAETFLVTGLFIDALDDRPPTRLRVWRHCRTGAVKGAFFGGLFILVLHGLSVLTDPAMLDLAASRPFLAAGIAGLLLYPLGRTIIESSDVSSPFLARLYANLRRPQSYVRGLVLGLSAAVIVGNDLLGADSGTRFVIGALIGVLAYAGVDVLLDFVRIRMGARRRFDSWRVYALGAGLGAFMGGAITWYLDAAQRSVIASKFLEYITVSNAAAGRPMRDYVVYPFFSKWGAIDLGQVLGGAKLFYLESLSGVINWAFAAPLFSINLFLLMALVQRSSEPLSTLFSRKGMVMLAENTVVVLRWGLWMAPIISSFLRMQPDPSWYNQDGAVRTVLSTVLSTGLDPAQFRAFSLQVFLGILAFDWLRVIVWFDHMGLRVATLVNLTFVGGDRLDNAAGRFVGHNAPARAIPEGIRRFTTWAPLLLPFYLPRGPEWDYVWDGADALRVNGAMPGPVATVAAVYVAAGLSLALGALLLARLVRATTAAKPVQRDPRAKPQVITNGAMTLTIGADGIGHMAVARLSSGGDVDLTRRCDDPLRPSGPFLYLREETRPGHPEPRLWSTGPWPRGSIEAQLVAATPTSLTFRGACEGLEVEICYEMPSEEAVMRTRLVLTNGENAARRFKVASYRQPALSHADSYRRDPSFAAMHVETVFIKALGAILVRNRFLKDEGTPNRRMSREVGFHAVAPTPGTRLIGYEDGRARFIGSGSLEAPAVFDRAGHRRLDDEGLAISFDPAASLLVEVELAAGSAIEVVFADGFADGVEAAAALLASTIETPPVDTAAIDAVLERRRATDPDDTPSQRLPFVFSSDGRQLHVDPVAKRPLTHVFSNPLGLGCVVDDRGAMFTFSSNARANALTPFALDTIASRAPGRAIYVYDHDRQRVDTAIGAPMQAGDSRRFVTYGLGYATFRSDGEALDLETTLFAPIEHAAVIELLTIRNKSAAKKRLTIAPFAEIVLAETPFDTRTHIRAEADAGGSAITFHNDAGNMFVPGPAFAATSLRSPCVETERARFLGHGATDFRDPVMVRTGRADLQAVSDGFRVAAFAETLEIEPGESLEVTFVLGQVRDEAEIAAITNACTAPAKARALLARLEAYWTERNSLLRVETNDPAFDRLVNDWLPYQVLTARVWGRTGPNQRSGAFGYRDQLQDVLPLLLDDPQQVKTQILLHARQQFRAGDVLKWWHATPAPELVTLIGERTRASDPHVWLPYMTARYIRATADAGILDVVTPFLEGDEIPHGRSGSMIAPRPSRDTDTLFVHCRLAIDRALALRGKHGLPLIGAGDWDDGLDRVGEKGRGESTWMAFFVYDILGDFIRYAQARGEDATAERWRLARGELQAAIDRAWRGRFYARVIADDGRDLNCINALAAAWPAMTGASSYEKALGAMQSGLEALDQGDRVLLVSPAFDDHSRPYPGRVADYPAGVRENGAQYSHGSSWLVDGLVALSQQAAAGGRHDEAARLRGRAVEIWRSISPLTKTTAERFPVYGLAPHQQPADVYHAAGYAGRGGWAWYTGAAARMLVAARLILGIEGKDGAIVVADDVFEPKGDLEVRAVIIRGERMEAPAPAAMPVV